MVGAPKHLHDLSKINADVRITCRDCRFEVDWTVGDLTRHLIEVGGNLTWTEVTRLLTCGRLGCGSKRLRATPVPCTRRQANLPERIRPIDAKLIETALAILEDAVVKSGGDPAATLEVELALLVLHFYVRDRTLVRAFWTRATLRQGAVHETLREPLAAIRSRLIQRGWLAPASSVERVPTWPWNSPPPPGWKAAPGQARVRDT